MLQERESWDQYFMKLAYEVSTRSTCLRRHVGAVAVNQRNRIIATGYNGPPSGLAHCTSDTCVRTKNKIPSGTQLDICKAIHAEANIVLYAGQQLEDATIYITNQPCTSCLKLLMGVGIRRIIWAEGYPDEYSRELMKEYGYLREDISMDVITLPKMIPDPDSFLGLRSTGEVQSIPGRTHYNGGMLTRK